MQEHFKSEVEKESVTESLTAADVTAAIRAILFRSESKGSGFHANERP